MSVTTPIFRLKVDAGDTGLVDKKGSAGALTGTATQTLIDRGSGEMAMRVSGGQLSIAIPSRTITAGTTGGGFSWAMDIAVENYGTVEYLDLINIGASVIGANATGSSANGISLERDGTNYLNFIKDDTTYSPQMSAGTAKHTIACRLTANVSGGYWRFDVWLDGTKYTGSLAGYGGDTLSTLTINATNSAQFNIRDLPVWAEELSDVDMSAVSTGLRATVDATGTGGGTPATVNLTAANSTQSNTSSTGSATVTPAGQQVTATVKTKPLAPFNGPVWTGITVPNLVVMKLDRTPVLSLSNVAVDGTAALPATDAALVAGTTYLMAYWNADGSLRGIETVVAV